MTAAESATVDWSVGSRVSHTVDATGCSTLQLDVLREMLPNMDTLTESGQRYTMAKIVAFLRSRIPKSGLELTPRNELAVGQVLDGLERESAGVVIDAERFGAHALNLFALLEALSKAHGTGRSDRRRTRADKLFSDAGSPLEAGRALEPCRA